MSNSCTIAGESLSVKIKEEVNSGEVMSSGFSTIARNETYSFDDSLSEIESPTVKEGRDQAEIGLGRPDISGEIEVPFDSTAIGMFFKTMLGEISTSVSGAKYLHNFSVSDKCLGTLQFEDTLKDIGSTYKTTGVKVNSFDLSLGEDGQINSKFGLLAENRFMTKILVDSIADTAGATGTVGDTTLDVTDGTQFEVGDTVCVARLEATTTATASDEKIVFVDNVAGLNKYDFFEISGNEGQIKSVGQDSVLSTQHITASTGSELNVLNNEYEIAGISGNTLTFTSSLISDVAVGDKVYRKVSNSPMLTKEFFHNSSLQINDLTGGDITDGIIETLDFSFSNEQEAFKTISKTKTVDGIVKSEVTIKLVLTKGSELLLEKAKIGYKFDLVVKMLSDEGNMAEIELYGCKIVPMSADRGTPGIVMLEIKATPTKNAQGKYINIKLLNDKATY